MHNGTAVEGTCLGEPQPFNTSRQPGAYVAAVLNLTAPTDFVLGDGIREQGYHNAALWPVWDYMALSPPHLPLTAGVCKLNTQILVKELLEALKRFKRAEIEAEQTEDESINRHGAGHLREYQKLASILLHPCNAGKELCNQSKNCYKSIIPYDHCHAVLQPSDTGNGYINASYVESYLSPRFFVAAQGPLPGTVVDFWQMVWQKTSVIVMLMSLVEQNKTKCEQYWPEQEQVYGDFTMTLNNTRTTTGLVTCIFCLQKEQYTFLYKVLLEGLLCGSTRVPVESIASHALQKFSKLFQLLPCKEAEKPSNQPKNSKPGILPAHAARSHTDPTACRENPIPLCGELNQLRELDKTYVEFWITQDEAAYGCFHIHLISEEPRVGFMSEWETDPDCLPQSRRYQLCYQMSEWETDPDFTAWTLALTNRQQPKKSALEARFWQLKDWPMKQHLPPYPATIISLLGKVETHQWQSQHGHILITCWDGASQSRIFCAASFLCEIQSEGLVDVSQAVRMLKKQQRQLIKDVEQYGLCYELVLSYLNPFETYGNFK
ncbi:LOW QUALITY PROTEIN: receptor-type tyrosine-protein phosphatase T-like [Ciconia maguari]